MEIIVNNEPMEKYRKLIAGDVFKSVLSGAYYIKTDYMCNGVEYSINLRTGCIGSFYADDDVVLLNAKVVIE